MPPAARIPLALWDRNKEHIRGLYLEQDKTLDELVQCMAQDHGFHASRAQYIRRLDSWKMRKNSTKKEWEYAGALVAKRKLNGKDTEIVMGEKVVPAKKLKKELGRYPQPQLFGHEYSVPSEDAQEGIIARTPPAMPSLDPGYIKFTTVPWFKFQDSLISQASLASRCAKASRARALSHVEQVTDLTSVILGEVVSRNLNNLQSTESVSQLASRIEETLPQMPNNGHSSCPRPQDIVVQMLRWAIHRLSNNLLTDSDSDAVFRWVLGHGNMQAIKDIFDLDCSTTNVILPNLLLCAIRIREEEMVRVLLERGINPNVFHPVSHQSALHLAIFYGQDSIAQLLLDYGADPNTPSADILTPLRRVIKRDEDLGISLVKMLIRAGANLNTPFFGGSMRFGRSTLLMDAAAEPDIALTELLLEAGADVNFFDTISGSALHLAVQRGSLGVVKALLRAGANPNIPFGPSFSDIWKDICEQFRETRRHMANALYTPLDIAYRDGLWEIAQLLIQAGAHPALLAEALHNAIGQMNHGLVEFCLMNGADVHARYERSQTALQLVCERQIPGWRQMVGILLRWGADVNAPPGHKFGSTALQAAVKTGNIDLVLLLLERGADLNAPPCHSGGLTALQAAAKIGNIDLVQLLLDRGADVNAPPCYSGGLAAMQAAVTSGNLRLVEIMVQRGGNINAKRAPEGGTTCLQAAVDTGDLELVNKLLALGAQVNAAEPLLQAALKINHEDMALSLLEAGANINSELGRASPLCCAILQGNCRLFELLMSKGAIVDPPQDDPTPLHAAVAGGPLNMTRSLIDAGANINRPSHHGYHNPDNRASMEAPLVTAITKGNDELVELLINAGANINPSPTPSLPLIPLQCAMDRKNLEMVQLLLSHGADVNPPQDIFNTFSPLGYAIRQESRELVQLLLSQRADPNRTNEANNSNALHTAIYQLYKPWEVDKMLEIVGMLLDHNVDVNAHSLAGSPIQLTSRLKGEKATELAKMLLGAGADVNCPPSFNFNMTPLQAVIETGQDELARIFFAAGADINAPACCDGGATALQAAAKREDLVLVRDLISRGANINAPAASTSGATALQFAAIRGNFNLAVLLLENGADVNAPKALEDGRTALEGAAEHGRLDMVHLLLDNDNEEESLGSRCLDAAELAEENGHVVIAEILRAWKCGHGSRHE
ncbi:hypothetical protein NM208_g9489 [Fusarium decemcellulare]|uniref:Uncharacterized protein n=1 Tax=Fusarium decemcellulare TaxID=57161 RepID=A0ACC1S1J9_9HYPO|nr:hypothetical protein NM208_g9489 [Fusarium decemcellulare]